MKKFLTEKVLKECWHAFTFNDFGYKLCKCNGKPWIFGDSNERIDLHTNRTFDNRSDLMDLYQKIYEDGKWDDFFWDFAFKRKPENYGLGEAETSVWLFCLDGKDYEAQCKMVAEFYGWEEK